MKLKELNKIEKLIYFNKEQLKTIFPNSSENSLKRNLYRWNKENKILSLKGGLYMTKNTFERFGGDIPFREYIASVIKNPSYLSLDYVLRKYEVLTEATYGFTSVTLKTGDTFTNSLGTFSYRKLKKELFIGYFSSYFADNEYFIATKAKALFDWFYYKMPLLPGDLDKIDLVEEFRLNLDSFTKEDWQEFESYANLAKSSKLKNAVKNIVNNAPNNI